MALLVCSGCSTRFAPGLESCPHCGLGGGVEEGSRSGARLPSLDVACGTKGCRAYDVVRRVYLRQAAPGVVELPTLACAVCGSLVASLSKVDSWATGVEETNMPKITRHGGASNAADKPVPVRDLSGPLSDEEAEQVEQIVAAHEGEEHRIVVLGEEESSPGSSSETSPEKPPSSPETTESGLPKRARTTGSRSSKARGASSTAPSTGSSTEADAS